MKYILYHYCQTQWQLWMMNGQSHLVTQACTAYVAPAGLFSSPLYIFSYCHFLCFNGFAFEVSFMISVIFHVSFIRTVTVNLNDTAIDPNRLSVYVTACCYYDKITNEPNRPLPPINVSRFCSAGCALLFISHVPCFTLAAGHRNTVISVAITYLPPRGAITNCSPSVRLSIRPCTQQRLLADTQKTQLRIQASFLRVGRRIVEHPVRKLKYFSNKRKKFVLFASLSK